MTIDFNVGDTIRVNQKIQDGEKTRIQAFEGTVIAINRTAKSFTVRKVSSGVGVERIWPIDSPKIESILKVKDAPKMRRAKLYYFRERSPREVAKITSKR